MRLLSAAALTLLSIPAIADLDAARAMIAEYSAAPHVYRPGRSV